MYDFRNVLSYHTKQSILKFIHEENAFETNDFSIIFIMSKHKGNSACDPKTFQPCKIKEDNFLHQQR